VRAHTIATVTACAAAAGALVACGGTKSPAEQVRDVVTRFGQASAKKDYQTICDDLIAKSLSANVEQFGLPCELAFKKGLESVRQPKLVIRRVQVKGSQASVLVHSTATGQAPSDDVLRLRKEAAGWRITALAQPVTTKRSRGS
jgi:hypothetical protein